MNTEENDMAASPIDVVSEWLQNLLDPDFVRRVVAPDAAYVSLNTENPELHKIMPSAGTSHGPQAVLDNLGQLFTRLEDSYAAASSFRKNGSWVVQTEPDAEPFEV
jgi:hypothetical protein